MPRWQHPTFYKIHENCGGLVRWVEAYDQPSVGWTGECQWCDQERIDIERIIPVAIRGDRELYDRVDDLAVEDRRDLGWDIDDEWQENQKRLADQILKVAKS